MRRLTLALLCGAYLCLSLIVALTLWRNGGGWGAGVAALVGGLGLCFAFHGLIERALDGGAMRSDLDTLREAHRLFPENWTYKRQAWNFEDPMRQGHTDAYDGSWYEDIKKIGAENYYADLIP